MLYHGFDVGPSATPFPTLPKAAEPAPAAVIAQAILNDDPKVLARLDKDILTQLQAAINPIVEVRTMKFVGAVEKDGRVLVAYLAGGRDSQGTDALIGFVLSVQADQIVGVN